MSWFLENLPPRSFGDMAVPCHADGSLLRNCVQEGDYEAYVRWLADYLHAADLPLTPEQCDWLEAKPRSAKEVIFHCSDTPGHAVWDLDILEGYFEAGYTGEEYNKVMRDAWLDSTAPEDREEFAFEELSPKTFARLRREWLAQKGSESEWAHADMPYRPLLAWALHQMPDAEVRRKEMHWFFSNYCDNTSK